MQYIYGGQNIATIIISVHLKGKIMFDEECQQMHKLQKVSLCRGKKGL